MTRITYTFLDGPLAGRIMYHAVVSDDTPETLANVELRRLVTVPKGSTEKLAAQGRYHIEKRGNEFVGIHHPDKDVDEEWHPLEQRKLEEPAVTAKRSEAKEPAKRTEIPMPDDYPLKAHFLQLANAIKQDRK